MIASAGAAAAAAAARIRALHEEEERLTAYSPDDLAKGWEFKIVRANTAAFRKSEVMQQVCDEEARTGWELVEKFDDSRLRFKRPTSARNNPSPTGLDPYRTTYGMSQGKLTTIILIAVFGSMALIFAVILIIAKVASQH
jgi:predicted alpha/beta-hydrolase family hydrolase